VARLRDEEDVRAEFEAHIAHRVDDLVAEGVPLAVAQGQARAEFGDARRLAEQSLDLRERRRRAAARTARVDALRQDLAYFVRQIRRGPAFALTAVATLGIGMGAAMTIVSVVDAVVLEPLPFKDPDQVVIARMLTPQRDLFSVSEAAFTEWVDRATSFEQLAAFTARGATLRSPGQPRAMNVGHITHGFLDVLGADPVLGRMFSAEEDLPGGQASVALISCEMWRTDFAGEADVLGARLDIDGRSFEIIGVMPDGVEVLTGDIRAFVPLGPDPDASRDDHELTVVGRLVGGVTPGVARAELQAIQRSLSETYVGDRDWSATVLAARGELIGASTVRGGWILLAAAGLFLLMACVNVSNFMILRATTRRVEMGIRTALGASRPRLVRQLLTESALFATLGGSVGLLLARASVPAVVAMGGSRVPRLDSAEVDGTAIVACFLCVVCASLLCGLAPVLRLPGRSMVSGIGAPSRISERGGRLSSLLIGGQIAATVVLLAGAGLLLRSFAELTSVDPGFEAGSTLAVRLDMPPEAYPPDTRAELVPTLRRAMLSVPGVSEVGATAVDPFSGLNLSNFVARSDRLPDAVNDFTPIRWRVVTPGFFEAMGLELQAGRTFSDLDVGEGTEPVVIGQSLARSLWGDQSPLGRVLVWGDPDGSRLQVVGVVEDLRDVDLLGQPGPIVYRVHAMVPWSVMTFVVRIEGEPPAAAAGLRDRMKEVAPGLPVPEIRSLEQNLRGAVAVPRLNVQLMSVLAIVGLLLAIMGVYGLSAFDTRRRFREIGIRMALGARPASIPVTMVRRRMSLIAVGTSVGLTTGWVMTRWIESQLFGVTRNDPATWLGVIAVVGASSVLAAYVPAKRASHVDPRDVLSGE
jgi:predicted permease